jgi:hypothetical protein
MGIFTQARKRSLWHIKLSIQGIPLLFGAVLIKDLDHFFSPLHFPVLSCHVAAAKLLSHSPL